MTEGAATESPRRLRDGFVPCLVAFVGLRVGLFVIAAIAVTVLQPRTGIPSVPGWPTPRLDAGWHNLFTAFEREDALWFLRIASGGYRISDGSAAFFPLYPLCVRAVSWITGGHSLLASLLVSNGAFFGALLLLYDLTVTEFSEKVARKTILYVCVFPTAFFFLAPYSESLFLLLSVAAFRFARRDRWVAAAGAGALAALTRSVGVVLAPALLFMAFEQRRTDGAALLARIAASTGVLLGPLAYLGWWQLAHGDGLEPVHAQSLWQRELTNPVVTLWRAAVDAAHVGAAVNGYWIIDLLVVGAVIAAVVLGWRLLDSPYLVYAVLSLLVPLSYPFPPRPLLSMPRFVVVIFPAFWVMADAAERRRLPHSAIVGVFAAGLGLLATLFVNWWYIF